MTPFPLLRVKIEIKLKLHVNELDKVKDLSYPSFLRTFSFIFLHNGKQWEWDAQFYSADVCGEGEWDRHKKKGCKEAKSNAAGCKTRQSYSCTLKAPDRTI